VPLGATLLALLVLPVATTVPRLSAVVEVYEWARPALKLIAVVANNATRRFGNILFIEFTSL
jgi:hypothetical protein